MLSSAQKWHNRHAHGCQFPVLFTIAHSASDVGEPSEPSTGGKPLLPAVCNAKVSSATKAVCSLARSLFSAMHQREVNQNQMNHLSVHGTERSRMGFLACGYLKATTRPPWSAQDVRLGFTRNDLPFGSVLKSNKQGTRTQGPACGGSKTRASVSWIVSTPSRRAANA